MARAVRLLLVFASLLPVAAVGCNTQADNTPNPELGPPPNIPPGRGEKGQSPPVDPKAKPRK